MNFPKQRKLAENIIDQRIEYLGHLGTIKYYGPLLHIKADPDQKWLGVKWDDLTRGRHNGTVEGVEYFDAGSEKGGSLLKFDKVNLGVCLFDALLTKYFKEPPSVIKERMVSKDKPNQGGSPMKLEEEKKLQEGFKQISVEYDESCVFQTTKHNQKRVQFYGFDQIWKRLSNLNSLIELSLNNLCIADVSQPGFMKELVPNLRVLSLESNLIYNWNQIYQIGYELEYLEELALSENYLQEPEPLSENSKIMCCQDLTTIDACPLKVFKNLRALALIQMKLTWKQLFNVLPAFPQIEELIVCRNQLTDFENVKLSEKCQLSKLVYLNLEENGISDFSGVLAFQDLPCLEKLIMNKNLLSRLGKITGFKKINIFLIERNLIEDCKIFHDIAQLSNVQYLKFQNNPFYESNLHGYLRQRAIAQIKSLVAVNGSNLHKYERKDCEIYYMKKVFEEYFKIKKCPDYDYDFQDFLNFAEMQHFRIPELIKIYGNPYEPLTQEQIEYEQLAQNKKQEVQIKAKPKSSAISLKLIAKSGPLAGSQPIVKKFPETTTVQLFKNIISKLFKIQTEQLKIYHRIAGNTDNGEEIKDNYKPILAYNIQNDEEIIIEEN